MSEKNIYVNNADVSSENKQISNMPSELLGLFFFAYRDFVCDADALLATKNLGRAHHRVLYFVNIKQGMSVATLLSILKITKQSLARVLKELIETGYIEQKTGENDRRQRLLYATKKGQELFNTLSHMQTERIEAALAKQPKGTKKIVKQFFIDMVNQEDQAILDRLKLKP
ncbi:MAG: MarR family transcriptional regulator [Devosiaceae bacterium]|nr:MarR family transcriptional regulator [Devosiaceae bacterium]